MFQRGIGLLALAAVATWGVLRDPADPVQSTEASESESAPGAKPTDPAAEPNVIGIPLLRAHGYPTLSGTLDVLVVTLPDPIASHLDWAFDSHLDAVRRAFERAGYVLDRFDLPWKPGASGDPVLAIRPGVLLFRRRNVEFVSLQPDMWLVYVVGEMSTRGISACALRAAVAERRELLAQTSSPSESLIRPLRIVGPTFSGSSRSLREELSRLRAPGSRGEWVQIVSGAATSPGNRAEFEFGDDRRVDFLSTVHTDGTLLAEFERVLADFGIAKREVAVLQESTTAYGAGLDTSGAEWLTVPFPMSIGSLRRASARGSAGGFNTGLGLDTAQTRTGLDLTDEPRRLETPGPATKLTPASIDLLLDETTRTLSQRNIKAALLFASDVRDKLFLGSELKKRLPDLQLFTFEGNVLYLRPEYNPWLRGMVVMSTYPLLLRDARWRPQSPGACDENLLFANEGAEGTFNATLVQLDRPELLGDYTSSLEPAATKSPDRPGVWATVVGASMMLPLTLAPAIGPADTPLAVPVSSPTPGYRHAAGGGKPISILILTWIALATLASFWLAYADRGIQRTTLRLRGMVRGLPREAPRNREGAIARVEQVSVAVHYHMYRSVLHASLLSLLLPIAALILSDGQPASTSAAFAAGFLAFGSVVNIWIVAREGARAIRLAAHLTPSALQLVRYFPRRDPERTDWLAEIGLRVVVAITALAFGLLTIWHAGQILAFGTDGEHLNLFRLLLHRNVEVDQGVSFLVPLTLVGLLGAAWARWHLYRLDGLSRPEPAEGVLERSGIPCARVRASLFRVLPARGAILLLAGLVPAGCWAWLQFGRTHDGALFQRAGFQPTFDVLLALGILAALLGSIWAAFRALRIWIAFRRVLAGVAVPTASLPFADLRQSLGLHVNLGLWPAVHEGDLLALAMTRWRVFAADASARTSPFGSAGALLGPLPDSYATLSELPAEERARQLDQILPDFLGLRPSRTRTKPAESADEEPAATRASKEVLASELILYFESVVRQLRVLSFLLFLSVVLTTLLVNSYPFQPRQLLQTAALFVFAGVIVCLVWVIGSMNRNPTLSRASGSKPGELTWDRTLVANLALYAIVPILALVTSQNPALRDKLFEWVKPLVQFLVTA